MFRLFRNWGKKTEGQKNGRGMSAMTYEKLMGFKGEQEDKFRHLWGLVGNTPMLEILYRMDGRVRSIHAKCEQHNLTGSIKDRVALYTLQKAYAEKLLKPYSRILVVARGHSAVSWSAVGRAMGHPVTVLVPEWMGRGERELMLSYGAEIMMLPGGDKSWMSCLKIAADISQSAEDIFFPADHERAWGEEAHAKTTAREICWQLEGRGLRPDALVAGVGTGATLMGARQYLQWKCPAAQVCPLELMESPFLTTGYHNGNRHIEGSSEDQMPGHIDLGGLGPVVQVAEADAEWMTRQIAAHLGMSVGLSSGANVLGAMHLQERLGGEQTVVTLMPGGSKCVQQRTRYSSDALTECLPKKIELLDYIPIGRAYEA